MVSSSVSLFGTFDLLSSLFHGVTMYYFHVFTGDMTFTPRLGLAIAYSKLNIQAMNIIFSDLI